MDRNGQTRYKDLGRSRALSLLKRQKSLLVLRYVGMERGRVQREVMKMVRNSRIVLSRPDVHRLRTILGAHRGSLRDREHLNDLYEELEQARILDEDRITPDIVTIESAVRVRDSATGVSGDYVLVPPAQADLAAGHISVLAPFGTALLGYREGDEVEWQMPGGVRRLRIEKVRQPERSAAEREEDVAV